MTFVSIGGALRSKLVVDIPTLITPANRIFPQKLPQNTKISAGSPAVTYKVLADVPTDDIKGRATLYKAILQYQTWAVTALEAQELADKIRLSLVTKVDGGFQGVLLGVTIRGIYHLHEMEDFEEEVIEYQNFTRFSVWYRR